MHVSRLLQEWYAIYKRDLPWRETCDPYQIWLSEVILQQTRVMQGLEYYRTFIRLYPRVEDLARAAPDDVLKTWQGLGYYTRARNLHETAQYVATRLKGVFPGSYGELLKLKGIGKYSAAAIASIAFREPVAVVDGNVCRVLSRVFGIDLPVDSNRGKAVFYEKASEILDEENPDIHNQAIMEFGALVCTPKNPNCRECPFTDNCVAYRTGRTGMLPVKTGKKQIRDRYFNYFHIMDHGHTWIGKRDRKDIWNSLYELPLIETPGPCTWDELSSTVLWRAIFGDTAIRVELPAKHYTHKLTHQTIHCNIYRVIEPGSLPFTGYNLIKISISDLSRYAIPRLLEKYLADQIQESRV